MWTLICDIFGQQTLLNKLAARRRFYTAELHDQEKIFSSAARVSQLAATSQTMSVSVEDSKLAVALSKRLSSRFGNLTFALDAAHTENTKLSFKSV